MPQPIPLKAARLWSVFIIAAVLAFFLSALESCQREYSFERRPVDSTTIQTGTTNLPSSCRLCNNTSLPDSSWQFEVEGVRFCGKAEKAIITLERTSFTFFGASSCSADSGFVATVYLDGSSLTASRTNLPAKLVFYYYDNVQNTYVYMSQSGRPLQLNITSYDHNSGYILGSFSGFVQQPNGTNRSVNNGRFRVQVR